MAEHNEKVVDWMCSNHCKLNADKTHFLTVGIKQRLNTLDGIQLEESQEVSELLLGFQLETN